jgi:hypothetical protein
MALIDTPEAANRLARAIASDLSLYNDEKVVRGLQEDNFFEVMSEELEEGRELYKSRVHPDLFSTSNFYNRAIVDVIIKPKAAIRSSIW